MRVKLIMAQYKCRYPGEYAPNVVDAWDEYTLEGNYEGFEEELAKHQAMRGTDYEQDGVKVLDIVIPEGAIDTLFDPPGIEVISAVEAQESPR